MSELELSNRLRVRQELAKLIELNLREAEATRTDLERAWGQAQEHGFFAVCVNSSRVLEATNFLEASDVKIVCSVGFPSGGADSDVKRFETEVAIDQGAQIIEVLAHPGKLKEGDLRSVLRELRDIVEAAEERPVGVALRTTWCALEQLPELLGMIGESGVKGITLLGASAGELVSAVQRVRPSVSDRIGIKVEQQTWDVPGLAALLEAGAVRFGMSQDLSLFQGLE